VYVDKIIIFLFYWNLTFVTFCMLTDVAIALFCSQRLEKRRIDKCVNNFVFFEKKKHMQRLLVNPSIYIFCTHLFVDSGLLTPVTVKNVSFPRGRRPWWPAVHWGHFNFGTREKPFFSLLPFVQLATLVYFVMILYQPNAH